MSEISPKTLQISREELSFLILLCSEEAIRTEYERQDNRLDTEEHALSIKRENTCFDLLKILTSVSSKCDEADGMEGRPELN